VDDKNVMVIKIGRVKNDTPNFVVYVLQITSLRKDTLKSDKIRLISSFAGSV
jgi:hypothetical protein